MTASPDHSATEPLLDGRYLLHECVGEGGMARVYRADDLVLERTVAIKLLRAGADTATPERARREMTVLAGLNHPSLVTLYDARAFPDREDYLVMEFVDGPSLSARLADGPLPAGDLARIVAEIGDALRVVHAAGIVHRDIKPSNVLLASTGVPGEPPRAKLADFGVAYLVDSTRHTTPGLVVGTGAYLAPEQVRGEPLTPAADIYALGLLMLEAVTGGRAFPHATGIGAILARLNSAPEIPEWVGEPWSRLIRAMTASDPTDRPDAAAVAAAARALPTVTRPQPTAPAERERAAATPTLPLEVPALAAVPVASGDPIGHTPHGAITPARARRRARPWIAAAAAVAIVVAGWWALTSAGGVLLPAPTVPAVTEQSPEPSGTGEPDPPATEQTDAGTVPADAPAETVTEQTDPAGGPGELVSERAPLAPAVDKAQREQEKAEKKAAEEQKRAQEKAQREQEKAQREQEKADKTAAEDKKKPGPGAGVAP